MNGVNVQFRWHHMQASEALIRFVMDHLKRSEKLLEGATDLVIRMYGARKSGYAQKFHIANKKKKKSILVHKFTGRRADDYYEVSRVAIRTFFNKLNEVKSRERAMARHEHVKSSKVSR